MNFSLSIISVMHLFFTFVRKGWCKFCSTGTFSDIFYFISDNVAYSLTWNRNSRGFYARLMGKYFIENLMSFDGYGIGKLSMLNGSNDIDIILHTVHWTLDLSYP